MHIYSSIREGHHKEGHLDAFDLGNMTQFPVRHKLGSVDIADPVPPTNAVRSNGSVATASRPRIAVTACQEQVLAPRLGRNLFTSECDELPSPNLTPAHICLQ